MSTTIPLEPGKFNHIYGVHQMLADEQAIQEVIEDYED